MASSSLHGGCDVARHHIFNGSACVPLLLQAGVATAGGRSRYS